MADLSKLIFLTCRLGIIRRPPRSSARCEGQRANSRQVLTATRCAELGFCNRPLHPHHAQITMADCPFDQFFYLTEIVQEK